MLAVYLIFIRCLIVLPSLLLFRAFFLLTFVDSHMYLCSSICLSTLELSDHRHIVRPVQDEKFWPSFVTDSVVRVCRLLCNFSNAILLAHIVIKGRERAYSKNHP
ncbi:hypothetical protein B0H34DRAFT_701245 [Crassisporium funariophilum]|nr:hypothetical protein B0H34DRAFT_701245 [Crassisporium funariophilum]